MGFRYHRSSRNYKSTAWSTLKLYTRSRLINDGIIRNRLTFYGATRLYLDIKTGRGCCISPSRVRHDGSFEGTSIRTLYTGCSTIFSRHLNLTDTYLRKLVIRLSKVPRPTRERLNETVPRTLLKTGWKTTSEIRGSVGSPWTEAFRWDMAVDGSAMRKEDPEIKYKEHVRREYRVFKKFQSSTYFSSFSFFFFFNKKDMR